MNTYQAELLYPANNILGEGAMWNKKRNSLMWVDIEGKKLHEYNFSSKKTKIWQLSKRVSLIIETNNENKLLLAVQGGIISFDLTNENTELLAAIDENDANLRTNDGSIDPLNRIWVGTMTLDAAQDGGKLYCINQKDYKVEEKLSPVSIPNGMVWTKDNTNLYFIDSPSYSVKSYTFDSNTGNIEFQKEIIRIPESLGMPDGMCQDSEGMLWIAIWGGACVLQFDPNNGKCLSKIEVPAPHITSCIFDGNNSNKIYITSAKVGMNEDQIKNYPQSGAVFQCEL